MGYCFFLRQKTFKSNRIANSLKSKESFGKDDKIIHLEIMNTRHDTGGDYEKDLPNNNEEEQKINYLDGADFSRYFSVNITNNEDPCVEMILSTVEIISSMTELINFIGKTDKMGKFSSLFLEVLLSIKENNQNNEKSMELINFFLHDDESVRTLDPIEFSFHILKLLNNFENILLENYPNYYEEGLNKIPKEAFIETEEKFLAIINNNPFRKLFCLATSTPFEQVCHNFKCENRFVSIRCEAEMNLSFYGNEYSNLQNDLNERFIEKVFKDDCGSCDKFYENSQTRFKSHFINFPLYLIIKVLSKIDESDFKNGYDMCLGEILEIYTADKKYQLFGIICIQGQDSYSTILKIDEKWKDFQKKRVINDPTNYIAENAYVLYYKLNN